MNESTMSDHEAYEQAAAAYAIGALDADERASFEAHLASCEICRQEVAEFDRLNAAIGLAVDPVPPPASLKARTLARAAGEAQRASPDDRLLFGASSPARVGTTPVRRAPARVGLGTWLAAAAAVAAIAGLGGYAWSLHTQVTDLRGVVAEATSRSEGLRAELDSARRDTSRLTGMIDIFDAPDVVRVNLLGQNGAPQAIGQAYVSPTQGLVFHAGGLPPLEAGRVYQLWVIAAEQGPVSAGLFSVDPVGVSTVAFHFPPAVRNSAVKTLAVTAEPGPSGSPGPTTPILLAGNAG